MQPSDIPGLILWLKADAGTVQTDGVTACVAAAPTVSTDPTTVMSNVPTASTAKVGTWQDQSGNARNATQGTSANCPVLVQYQQGGKTVTALRFTNNQWLTLSSGIVAGTGPLVCYAVMSRGNTGRNPILSGTVSGSWEFAFSGTVLETVNTGIAVIRDGSTYLTANMIQAIRAKYVAGAVSMRSRGASDGSTAYSTNITAASTTIGLDNGSNHYWGDICELIVYNQDVSSVNEAALEAYFASKYLSSYHVVTDGNSITAAGPSNSGNATWVSRLPNTWNTSVWGATNVAVSGQTTASMLSDEATQIKGLIDALHMKNILLYWEGSNDIKGGATDATAYANLQTYGSNARGYTLAGAAFDKIILMTIWPRTDYTGTQETYRLSVNSSLRSAFSGPTSAPLLYSAAGGTTYADYLIDLAADPVICPTGAQADASNATYFADGIHGTSAAYDRVASIVVGSLNTIYPPPSGGSTAIKLLLTSGRAN